MKVARLAGVSQATVSRVINRQPGVSPENVKAVEEAIRKLKFVPRTRRRRTKTVPEAGAGTVAVLLLDDSYAVHSTLAMLKLQGVCHALRETRTNLIFASVGSVHDLPPLLSTQQVDGVLLWGHRAPAGLQKELGDLPRVWLSSHEGEGQQGTLFGNEAVGRTAAEHLIEQGCRQLAVLNVTHHLRSHRARVEGFHLVARREEIAARTIGGEGDDPTVDQRDATALERRIDALVDRLLKLKTRVDGLFVLSDQLTAITHRTLKRKGVDLRQELTIVSAGNDEPYLLGLDPRPATIDLSPELTGQCAARKLLWTINQPDHADRVEVVVTPKLVPGDRDNVRGS
ncbi:LacI family DNA-binding transcriptional regulator [Planctomycetes bacterium Pan216]|uniref:LacI family DNA-binding transcriptional regulator n=1 Tax=Kolteria novifilia TaxID=2527975 RepID=UPI0011A2230B